MGIPDKNHVYHVTPGALNNPKCNLCGAPTFEDEIEIVFEDGTKRVKILKCIYCGSYVPAKQKVNND